ncbi:MAG: acetolactate synthase small subunit [Puniceicoccales bacterium]|jgi:acetolactate synthase-1/3 small subunit|nr:acetolactate synthase small subunit [Puniceicoccales bacterium]
MNRHTLSALVENKFGVLARVAGMLSGRGFNIETLNVAPTFTAGLSRITATVVADAAALDRCVRALGKLVNVISVQDFNQVDFVSRELVVVKVRSSKQTRSELIEIAGLFQAKIIDVTPESLIIEFTGNETKSNAFLRLVKNYGILELARTGKVALARGENPTENALVDAAPAPDCPEKQEED